MSTIVLLVIFVASSLAAFEVVAPIVAAPLLAMLLGIHRWRMGDKLGRGIFLAGLLIFALLAALVFGVGQSVRELTYSGQCRSNLRQVALGMLNYEHANCSFPPAYVRGPDGKPWHSWRVLLLPSADADAVYKQYDFNEPWDGPKNRLLAEKMPYLYRCPSEPYTRGTSPTMANYVAVTGAGTVWPGSESRGLPDVHDAHDKTLLLVEIADSDIHWMEPRDLSLEELLRAEGDATAVPSSRHTQRSYFLFPEMRASIVMADGSVRWLPGRLSKEGLKALATIGGGGTIDLEDAVVRESIWRRLDWQHVVGLTLFVLALLPLTWQAFRRPATTRAHRNPESDQEADG